MEQKWMERPDYRPMELGDREGQARGPYGSVWGPELGTKLRTMTSHFPFHLTPTRTNHGRAENRKWGLVASG